MQSSGETCSVYFMPGNSLKRASTERKDLRRAVKRCWRRRLWRESPRAGRQSTHLPHWMHRSGSQTGISSAMLRFSQCAVPAGYVPSTGSALTGSASPSPAIMGPSTSRTNAGASAGTVGGGQHRQRNQ